MRDLIQLKPAWTRGV